MKLLVVAGLMFVVLLVAAQVILAEGSPCGAVATPVYAAGYVACVYQKETTSIAPKAGGGGAVSLRSVEMWG